MRMSGRTLFGLILILLGVLFFLDQTDLADFGDIISQWWPLILIGIGLAQALQTPRNLLAATIFVTLGVLFLLSNLWDLSFWSVVWPLAIIGAGVWLLVKRDRTAPSASSEAETIYLTATFAGLETASTSRSFRGGSLNATFGGLELDLHQAILAPEGATLSATALFGGIDIRVPRSWRVIVEGNPIFGGIENSATLDTDTPESAPSLTIKASVLFGGLEINNKR